MKAFLKKQEYDILVESSTIKRATFRFKTAKANVKITRMGCTKRTY